MRIFKRQKRSRAAAQGGLFSAQSLHTPAPPSTNSNASPPASSSYPQINKLQAQLVTLRTLAAKGRTVITPPVLRLASEDTAQCNLRHSITSMSAGAPQLPCVTQQYCLIPTTLNIYLAYGLGGMMCLVSQ